MGEPSFHVFTQSNRLLKLTLTAGSALATDAILPYELSGSEGISSSFNPLKKDVKVDIVGYNYTDQYMQSFSVNGHDGGHIFLSSPTSGGGGPFCCFSYTEGRSFPYEVKVEWANSAKDGHHPIEIYFMGLFDTVASVGAPPAAKNWLRGMRKSYNNPLLSISPAGLAQKAAFNALDVFLSQADGHVAWGGDMRIPDSSLVKHCEHMIAAHEFRNSFPVDLVLDNGNYAANCRETVYPGAHSNVGGGYRPGECGKSDTEAELLSQIPPREMHKIAIGKGVPLMKFEEMPANALKGFVLDATLTRRYNHYMQQAGFGNQPVNAMYLAHMKWYFRWRIIHVGRILQAEKSGTQTDEEKSWLRMMPGLPRKTPSWKRSGRKLRRSVTRHWRPTHALYGKSIRTFPSLKTSNAKRTLRTIGRINRMRIIGRTRSFLSSLPSANWRRNCVNTTRSF
jgi:hypothetical protein